MHAAIEVATDITNYFFSQNAGELRFIPLIRRKRDKNPQHNNTNTNTNAMICDCHRLYLSR
jgi:hypothetical protein